MTGRASSGHAGAARRLRVLVAGGGTFICLACAGPAAAHLRSGTVAVDYRASIFRPVTPAYSARIYESDEGLTLTARRGHVVVMLGYLDEPVFRLDAAGLWVNIDSPTAAGMRLVAKARAGGAADPHWQLQRGRRTVLWHDARVRGLPVGLDHGIWMVPLIVDGHRTSLRGALRRFPAPALWLWLCVLAGWPAAAMLALLMCGRVLARRAAIGLAWIAACAAAVTAFAFALDPYASPGTWIEGLDALAFLAVGVGVLGRGPPSLHIPAVIGIGLVALAVGLLEGTIFLHPIVLAVLPGTVMRILVTAAIGAGLTAAGLGALFFAEVTEGLRDAGQTFGLSPPHRDAPDRPRHGPSGA